jgi:hypothetical protein
MRALAAWLTVAIALAGCGGGEAATQPDGRLSAGERAAVERSVDSIYAFCRRVRDYFSGRSEAPSRSDGERAERAVAGLVEAARNDPEAEYAPSRSLRTLVGDTAEDLEATNCSGALVRLLQRGFASLPPRE